MEQDSGLTKAVIAMRQGLSRARVTQLMNLLELPKQIQKDLQRPPAPLDIHSFSERCLRQILACDDLESQLSKWQEMIRKAQILVQQ